MWRHDEILTVATEGLRAAERVAEMQQAVYGLDALAELELHPVLAEAFAGAGYGVVREQAYPGEYRRRPLPRDRERCDLVLLPEGGTELADPLALVKQAEAAPLFVDMEGVPPEDAYWLEVKTLAQYAYVDGVPVPNRSYASQLVRGPAVDLAKLARERMIDAGGALVVVFGAERAGVRHDLGVMVSRLVDRDIPIGPPEMGFVEIADRAGNAWAGVCLVPLRAARD